jgi:hypothetical protein
MTSKLKHFSKMLELQCVRTIRIGSEIVVLMLLSEMQIGRLSLIFCKHILQTMQLRNYRLVDFIVSWLKVAIFNCIRPVFFVSKLLE